MTTEQGCPWDRSRETTFSWSGADISAGDFITGDFSRLARIEDQPAVDRRPKEEVVRCRTCGNIWHLTFAWPDRPPCHLEARMVPQDALADFFLKLGERFRETYA